MIKSHHLFPLSILLTRVSGSACDLPQDEREGVHVSLLERVEVVFVESFVENFRCHVSLGALPRVRKDVHLVCFTEEKQWLGCRQ